MKNRTWLMGYLTIADFFFYEICFYLVNFFGSIIENHMIYRNIKNFKNHFESQEFMRRQRDSKKIFPPFKDKSTLQIIGNAWEGDKEIVAWTESQAMNQSLYFLHSLIFILTKQPTRFISFEPEISQTKIIYLKNNNLLKISFAMKYVLSLFLSPPFAPFACWEWPELMGKYLLILTYFQGILLNNYGIIDKCWRNSFIIVWRKCQFCM